VGTFFCCQHGLVCFHGVDLPHVAADDAVVADVGLAAQNGCASVDHHVAADVGVTLHALHGVAVRIDLEALCTQRHALIELYVFSDDAGLANDNAGAVVNEEIVTDGGAGMDVNAGDLLSAGTDALVAGSFIFKGDIRDNVRKLRECKQA